MSMPQVNEQQVGKVVPINGPAKAPKARYMLGKSGWYCEVGDYLAELLNRPLANDKRTAEERLTSLLTNAKGNSSIEETDTTGRSLKVMLHVEQKDAQDNVVTEVKFVAFVTHGDAKRSLDASDIPAVAGHAKDGIIKAISASEVISLF
jgi:hypothetical protein